MTEHNNVIISRELLRQILDYVEKGNPGHIADRINVLVKLRAALEQPAVEPVSHQYQDSSGKWCNFMNESHYVNTKADGRWPIRALYAAPQAQQPPRIGTGASVEQTLEQWEHDFKNPMTPEQQTDWVKREREFASALAQQPTPDTDIPDLIAGALGVSRGTAYDLMRESFKGLEKEVLTLRQQPATVLAMCDEVERLRKDAARYQWLRDHCARMTVASMSFVECPQSWYSDHDVESNDAAIDAAMEYK